MISPSLFIEELRKNGLEFYSGVPDSLLKDLISYLSDHLPNENHIIAANEGGAIGLAAGYHLATGKIPVVYMQNSGLGNAVNPLVSLMDEEVYRMPLLLIVGWRGEPGVKDEPQHIKQGKITIPLLETLGIKNMILSGDEQEITDQLKEGIHYIKEEGKPFALIIRKGAFTPYKPERKQKNSYTLSREEAISTAVSLLNKDAVIVSSTGMISRELFEYREREGQDHGHDFLTVGSMGHASQIALGIAMQTEKKVCCFDGDGAVLMHMGSMAITSSVCPANYYHIVFNNGAHDSVGGQPTVALDIDLPGVAKTVGYRGSYSFDSKDALVHSLPELFKQKGPLLIEIKVGTGNRPDLGRPDKTPVENKKLFMKYLLNDEHL